MIKSLNKSKIYIRPEEILLIGDGLHKWNGACSLNTVCGRCGALVESKPFDQRIVGSNPALAATLGPWASPELAVACGASA